ncbi:MAG: mechanosensitive ion channel family protein [Phycisphaerales bacterium]|nr:mechanosensitive ion channel family protein [Phycisphaerales bacterium]
MKRLVFAIAWITAIGLLTGASFGQQEEVPTAQSTVRPALESPRATMATFLSAMDRPSAGPNLELAAQCLDVSDITEEMIDDHARMIYGILIRIAKIDVRRLPDRAAAAELSECVVYPDRFPNRRIANAHPDGRIVIARAGSGEWRFSAETVASAQVFYTHVTDLDRLMGADERAGSAGLVIRSMMPAALIENEFLTIEYWQWLGIGLAALLGIVLDYSVRWLVLRLGKRTVAKRGGDADSETWKKVVRPFGLFAAALLWLFALRVLLLPDAALRILLLAVRLFLMLSTVWAAYRLTDLVAEVVQRQAAKTTTRFDDVLIPMVRKAAKVIITVFGLIYIADSMNIAITPLLTGLGIGGLGFAFAAKDTIENLFGSITVIADRPFEVGDWIVIGDVEGTVEELGFRSTRVRTFYNSLVSVPNATLVRATVDNFGRRKYRRAKTHIGIQYDTPPEKVDAFCEGIRELIRVHPFTRKDYYQVWLHEFGPSSLDILLYVFHEVPDWQTELRERHRLYVDIMRLADRLGVQFAFPTQTVHLFQEQTGAEHVPADAPPSGTERNAMLAGRRAVRELTAEASWRRKKPRPYVFTGPSTADEDEEDETQIESKTGGDG